MVPVGTHVLEVRYVGHATQTREITVGPDEPVTLQLELQTQAISLDEVVVTGTGVVTERRRLGQTVEILGGAEINAAPIQTIT